MYKSNLRPVKLSSCLSGVFRLSELELPVVELRVYQQSTSLPNSDEETHVELLALENVSVCSSTLTRSRGEDGEQSTRSELLFEQGIDLGVLFTFFQDPFDVVRLFLVLCDLGHGRALASLDEDLGVVRLVPLSERGGIDVDNAGFHEGLGSEKFVVRGVVSLKVKASAFAFGRCGSVERQLRNTILKVMRVALARGGGGGAQAASYACDGMRKATHDLKQPSLLGHMFTSPSKVSRVEPHSPVLGIPTSSPDFVNTFRRVEFGHGGLSTELELSLLSAAKFPSVSEQLFLVQDQSQSRTSCRRHKHSLVGPTGTRCGALVARVTSDTHPKERMVRLMFPVDI